MRVIGKRKRANGVVGKFVGENVGGYLVGFFFEEFFGVADGFVDQGFEFFVDNDSGRDDNQENEALGGLGKIAGVSHVWHEVSNCTDYLVRGD